MVSDPRTTSRKQRWLALSALAGLLWGLSAARAELSPRSLEYPADILATWVSSQQAFDRSETSRALDQARDGLRQHPGSAALLNQLCQLELATEGPRGLRSLVDSLGVNGPGEIPMIIARAHLVRAEGARDRADSMLATVATGLNGDPLDQFIISGYRIFSNFRRRANLGLAEADSILRWMKANPPPAAGDYGAGYFSNLNRGLEAALPIIGGERGTQVRDAITSVRDQAAARGLASLELLWTGLIADLSGTDTRFELEQRTRAQELARRLNDVRRVAREEYYLADVFSRRGELEKAMALSRRAEQQLQLLGDGHALGWCHLARGWYLWLLGEVAEAERYSLLANENLAARGDRFGQGMSLNNLGVIYANTDQREKSLEVEMKSLRLSEQSNNYRLQSWTLNNIATNYHLMGQTDKALEYYLRSLKAARRIDDREQMVTTLGNLGLASIHLGRVEQSRAFYAEAVRIARELGSAHLEARALIVQAVGIQTDHLWSRSESLLRLAHEASRRSNDRQQSAQIAYLLGKALYHQGKIDEAHAHLEDSVLAYRELGQSERLRSPLTLLARTHLLRERWEAALGIAEELEAESRKLRDPALGTNAKLIEAEAFWGLGRTAEAIEACRAAMNFLLQTREEWQTPSLAGSSSKSEHLMMLGYLAIDDFVRMTGLGRDDVRKPGLDAEPGSHAEGLREAFGFLQHLKARSLLDRLQVGESFVRPQIPRPLEEEERQAKLRSVRLYKRFRETGAEEKRLELAESEANYQRIRAEILEVDARYRRARVRRVARLSEIRSQLVIPGTVILDYLVPGPDEPVYLFVLDESGLELFELASSGKISEQVGFYLDLIGQPPTGDADEQSIGAAAEALFSTLMGPIADRIKDSRRLIISPDAILHRLPFPALAIPHDSSASSGETEQVHGPYLAELYAVNTVPSLSILCDLKKIQAARETRDLDYDLAIWPGPGTGNLSADADDENLNSHQETEIFDPLRFAEAESKALRRDIRRTKIFPRFIGDARGKQAFVQADLLGNARVIHLIAHGVFQDRRPWASGLYLDLTGEDEIDRLGAADVYYLDFSADLITLAACETARGTVLHGEGMQSFAQALFSSGATSVLATLWRIDDASTVGFMRGFYDGLASGLGKAEALAQAQRGFLATPELRHPFYWSSYVLLGEGEAVVPLKNRGVRSVTSTVFLGLAIVMLLLAIRARGPTRAGVMPDVSGSAHTRQLPHVQEPRRR